MTDDAIKAESISESLERKLRETYTQVQLDRVARSLCFMEPRARKRRAKAIVELSIEYGRIRDENRYSTMWCTAAIEELLEGDVDQARRIVEYLKFEDHEDDGPELSARFANFREMLLAALEPPSSMQ